MKFSAKSIIQGIIVPSIFCTSIFPIWYLNNKTWNLWITNMPNWLWMHLKYLSGIDTLIRHVHKKILRDKADSLSIWFTNFLSWTWQDTVMNLFRESNHIRILKKAKFLTEKTLDWMKLYLIEILILLSLSLSNDCTVG